MSKADLSRNAWRYDRDLNLLVCNPPDGSPYELELDRLDRDEWDPREQLRIVKHIAGKAWATAEMVWDLAILFQELEAAWRRQRDLAVPVPESEASRARGMLRDAQGETARVLEGRRNGMAPGSEKARLCRVLDSLARGCADADDELAAVVADQPESRSSLPVGQPDERLTTSLPDSRRR